MSERDHLIAALRRRVDNGPPEVTLEERDGEVVLWCDRADGQPFTVTRFRFAPDGSMMGIVFWRSPDAMPARCA